LFYGLYNGAAYHRTFGIFAYGGKLRGQGNSESNCDRKLRKLAYPGHQLPRVVGKLTARSGHASARNRVDKACGDLCHLAQPLVGAGRSGQQDRTQAASLHFPQIIAAFLDWKVKNECAVDPCLFCSILQLPAVGGPSLASSYLGMFIVFVYMWLPYMILPIAAALERVPASLIQASADLGAHPGQTFRSVILPLVMPGLAAGSVFTFSLTLGDYIIPSIVGAPGYFIGMMVYQQQGTAGNIPLAAAFSLVPILLIAIYLALVKRLGAFDAM